MVDLDQAHFASIIAGVSVRRGLPPRAASIAIATAYQETGIRNLDYGDRDSVGLFQQRPSQGWGTKQQLMDPDYATGKFYDALVKIENWETADINDVAQQVQRSGYPEAYRDHEADARVLASALTGQSPAGFSCLDRTGAAGDVKALRSSLERTFGKVDDSAEGSVITIRARSEQAGLGVRALRRGQCQALRRNNGEDRKQSLGNSGLQPPRLAGGHSEAQGRARRDHGSLSRQNPRR